MILRFYHPCENYFLKHKEVNNYPFFYHLSQLTSFLFPIPLLFLICHELGIKASHTLDLVSESRSPMPSYIKIVHLTKMFYSPMSNYIRTVDLTKMFIIKANQNFIQLKSMSSYSIKVYDTQPFLFFLFE